MRNSHKLLKTCSLILFGLVITIYHSLGQTNVLPSVRLGLTATPSPADSGNPLIIQASLSNPGTIPVQDLSLTYKIPDGVKYVGARPPIGQPVQVNDEVRIPMGNLEPGGTAVADLVVIPEEEGEISHEINVNGLDLPPDFLEDFILVPVKNRLDLGDAPDPTYPTLIANNGARSRIVRGWRLGPLIDREPDGQPSLDALGDDLAGGAPDDEDGVVFLGPLVPGMMGAVEILSNTNGFIDAWIDFAADGSWAEPGDQILTSAPVVRGVNVLNFPVPAGISRTNTYSRFRLSRLGGASFDGFTLFGEVEDYRVRIRQQGGVVVEVDPSDDLAVVGVPIALNLEALNATPDPVQNLVINLSLGWEPALGEVTSSQGSCELAGNQVICQLGPVAPGQLVHVQITVTPFGEDLVMEGTVSDGEGMDFSRFSYELPHEVFGMDFGDAPDPSFPTLLASNGARHQGSPLGLGWNKDYESNGQPHWLARGDDIAGSPDDEDGVIMLGPIIIGKGGRVQVIANGPGRLDAWIDFMGNGNWIDPGEQIFTSVPVVAGTNNLTFPIPAGAKSGLQFARFRISSAGGLSFYGPANDGEVEDYRFRVRPPRLRPDISIDKITQEHELSWEANDGVLQVADELGGPWQAVKGAASPVRIPTEGPRKFYRLWSPEPGMNLPGLLQKAQLVFEGTVVDVQYRNSEVDEDHPVSIPCTYVTFAITDILMGRYSEEHITLMFAGGMAEDGSIMVVSHSTLFDQGEQVIVFARKNGKVAVPLVHGGEGRFRIHDGRVFSEGGQQLIWNDDATVQLGARVNLDELQSNLVNGQLIQRMTGAPMPGVVDEDDDGEPSGPGFPDLSTGLDGGAVELGGSLEAATTQVSSQAISTGLFKEVVRDLSETVFSPEELDLLPQLNNIRFSDPVFVPNPRPLSTDRLNALDLLLPDVVTDEEEEQLYEDNGFNPVIP